MASSFILQYGKQINITLSIVILLIYFVPNILWTNYLIKNRDAKKWTASKFIPFLLLLIISWILGFIYIYVRITRKYNTIWSLLAQSPQTFSLPIILFVIINIVLLILKAPETDKRQKPDDKKPDDKKPDNGKPDDKKPDKKMNISTIIAIVVGIISSIIFGYILFTKAKGNLQKGILIGLMLIVVIVVVSFIMANYVKKEDKDQPVEKDSQYDLLYNDPLVNEKKTIEELEELLKKLGDFKMDNNCKTDGQSDCDNLYQQYIKSGGNQDVLNRILEQLEKTQNKTGLINQTIFLIYQLLQCKIDIQYKTTWEKFGTLEWWRKNILMYGGDDPIQQYIYAISVLLCFLFLVYNLLNYIGNSYTLFGNKDIEAIFGMIMTAIWIGTLLGSFFWFGTGGSAESKIDISDDMKGYQREDGVDTETLGEKWGYGLLGGNLGLLFISFIGSFFSNWMKINTISMLIAYIVAFNTYYMVIIPQLVIVGIIIQRYVLATNLLDNIGHTVVKIVLFIVILFASLYDTKYKDNTDPKIAGTKSVYNSPVWYIFGVFLFLLLENGLESMTGMIKDDNRWALILMPAMRYIIQFVAQTSIPYDAVSV